MDKTQYTKAELINLLNTADEEVKTWRLKASKAERATNEMKVELDQMGHLQDRLDKAMQTIETRCVVKYPDAQIGEAKQYWEPMVPQAEPDPEELLLLRYLYNICDYK